jgi:condensin complex subunit 1
MVALGDLAFRFPNAVEPWTEHLYGLKKWGNSLHDGDAGVRQHAITVLAHLVLNDMMKVKGHIAEMARCLEDPDPRVASVARLLFHELSRKHGNPIYNLLPDLLSRLSGDEGIEPEAFRRIMTRLLGFIDKDRQTEALADKFANRFAEAALAEGPKPARDVAFCLSQLQLSDKAFKKFMDQWKLYEPALYDKEVFASLMVLVQRAKKTYGGKSSKSKAAGADGDAPDAAKQTVEEFELKLGTAHLERYESYRSAKRAEGHVFDDDDEPPADPNAKEPDEEEEEEEDAHPLGALDGAAAAARDEDAEDAEKKETPPAEEPENGPEEDEEQGEEAKGPEDGDVEEEEEEEEEEENDENAPEPEAAPKKRGGREKAAKQKKVETEATAEEAPARASRRALRANR